MQMRTKQQHLHKSISGVPAWLGKGQGAKEIGHNLARVRPKFGHNLVRKRHQIGRSLEREWPILRMNSVTIQLTRTKRGLGTILWAIDENMGTNLQAFYIGSQTQKQKLHFVFKKKFRVGRCVSRAGRKTVLAGRSAL